MDRERLHGEQGQVRDERGGERAERHERRAPAAARPGRRGRGAAARRARDRRRSPRPRREAAHARPAALGNLVAPADSPAPHAWFTVATARARRSAGPAASPATKAHTAHSTRPAPIRLSRARFHRDLPKSESSRRSPHAQRARAAPSLDKMEANPCASPRSSSSAAASAASTPRAACAAAGRRDARRPPQPPPVPAAALPGGDRGADPRPTSPRRSAASCAAARTSTVLLGEVEPRSTRRASGVLLADGEHRLRLPDRRHRRDPLLLRPRRVGAARARPQDASRTRSRSAAACCSPSSAPSASPTRGRAARWLTFVVDRRRARPASSWPARSAEIARHTLARDFRRIDPTQRARRAGRGRDRASCPPTRSELSDEAARQLERWACEVRTGARVTAIDADGVVDRRRSDSPRAPWSGPPASRPRRSRAIARRAARPRGPRARRRPTSPCPATPRSS